MASADTAEKKIGNKNEKIGEVVSAKMAKTIVVEVTPARAASAVQADRQQAQEVLRAR